MPPPPKFFATLGEWRGWLEKNHARKSELWVGFFRRASARPSLTWGESVDGALCFGWIDGVRSRLDEVRYMIRFTPRQPRSLWSEKNIRRAQQLSQEGCMHPAGLAAFQQRGQTSSPAYSAEQRKTAQLPPAYQKQFRLHPAAWEFFRAQAPGYQRMSSLWVISAQKQETQARRLDQLIACSARRQPIPALARPSPRK
jgi:uncharacterized protein YdeI (YjbR/CyaY-like superfamily)